MEDRNLTPGEGQAVYLQSAHVKTGAQGPNGQKLIMVDNGTSMIKLFYSINNGPMPNILDAIFLGSNV